MKNNHTPEIQFKGFKSPWRQRKLGELVSIKSGWSPSEFTSSSIYNSFLFIKVNDLNYSSREQLNSNMKVKENPRFVKMKKGSTIFPKRGAAIMTNKVRIIGVDGYMDTNMMALEPKEIDKDFLYTFIARTGLYKIADTSTLPQINNKHIEPYVIWLPETEEQEKVGDFFYTLDTIIALHQQELDTLKKTKQGFLQKMFPKEGESVPEFRFHGFTEEWEQRKLGELVSIKSGWSPSNFSESDDQNTTLFIKVNDLNHSSREQLESKVKVHENPRFEKMKKGSTIFPKRGAAIMTNKVRILGSDGYMDTNMMALEPNHVNEDFLYTFIARTGLYKIADTSTLPQINNKHIEPYIICIPNIEEQIQIGNFFKQLDEVIALHQQELNALKQTKKAFLQKMFV